MPAMNPASWGKMPAQRASFQSGMSHEVICNQLSQILVDKLGAVQQITLETDAAIGSKVYNIHLGPENPFSKKPTASEIKGIPVRFVQYGEIKL